jgi:hypothetical protein
VLFLGGSIHQLIAPLEPLVIVGIAILPTLTILAWIAAIVKPTTNEGAAAADSLFDANSLFVCAWELSRSGTTHDGVMRLLLARTDIALDDWQEHDRTRQQRYIKPAGLLAITLSLVGLFFLLLPTDVKTVLSLASEPSAKSGIFTRSNDTALELSELFTVNKQSATQVKKQNPEPGGQSGLSGSTPPPTLLERDQTAASVTGENLLETEGQLSSNQRLSSLEQKAALPDLSANDSRKVPDRTAGNETAVDFGSPVSKSDQFKQISFVDIETGTDAHTAAFDKTRKGTSLITSTAAQADSTPLTLHTTLRRTQAASATLLTAQQRNLVRRYFKKLEKIDEQNE